MVTSIALCTYSLDDSASLLRISRGRCADGRYVSVHMLGTRIRPSYSGCSFRHFVMTGMARLRVFCKLAVESYLRGGFVELVDFSLAAHVGVFRFSVKGHSMAKYFHDVVAQDRGTVPEPRC